MSKKSWKFELLLRAGQAAKEPAQRGEIVMIQANSRWTRRSLATLVPLLLLIVMVLPVSADAAAATLDAPEEASGIHSASITSGKNPLRVVMPETPGDYELRYWNRANKRVAGRRPISVLDVPTSLAAPAEVEIVGQGIVGGAEVVPAGTFRVEMMGGGAVLEDVVVKPEVRTEVAF